MTNEMTAEEAVEILKYERDNDIFVATEYREKLHEALTKAIKALEQQPSEDCVNRSELQKTMDSLPLFRFVNNDHEEADDYYNCESVDMVIRNLPSVTPRRDLAETSQDCISRQAVIDFIIDNYGVGFNSLTNGIRDYLPSVTPKRPKGTWVFKNDNIAIPTGYYQCSECEEGKLLVKDNYCPNCGAEMSGGGEDEVSD